MRWQHAAQTHGGSCVSPMLPDCSTAATFRVPSLHVSSCDSLRPRVLLCRSGGILEFPSSRRFQHLNLCHSCPCLVPPDPCPWSPLYIASTPWVRSRWQLQSRLLARSLRTDAMGSQLVSQRVVVRELRCVERDVRFALDAGQNDPNGHVVCTCFTILISVSCYEKTPVHDQVWQFVASIAPSLLSNGFELLGKNPPRCQSFWSWLRDFGPWQCQKSGTPRT